MKQFTVLVFLVFIFSTIRLNAQRFKAYLGLGSNLTEAYLTQSGNSQVGSRLGLNIGPGVSAILNKRWEMNLELLYSQNGHYVNIAQSPTIALNKITLHFFEVPLALAYRFNIRKNEKENFYKHNISFGITYAHLFEHKILAINDIDVTNDIRFDRENALLFNFAATSFFSKSFALNARGTLSTFGEWTFALRVLYYI